MQKTIQNRLTNSATRLSYQVMMLCRKHPLRLSLALGLIYYGWQLKWLLDIRANDLTGEPWLRLVIAYSAYCVSVISFAIFVPLFVILLKRLRTDTNGRLFLVILTASWVVIEALRGWFFSIVTFGEGGRIGDYWHFANLGLLLVDTPLIYMVRFGGLFMLTACVATLIGCLWVGVTKQRWKPLVVVTCIIATLSMLGYGLYNAESGSPIWVGAMRQDTTVTDEETTSTLKALPDSQLDAMVLPEYTELLVDNTQSSEQISRVLRQAGITVYSEQVVDGQSRRNLLTFAQQNQIQISQQDKWFLIPGGEFVPYFFSVPLTLLGQHELVREFETKRTITPAASPEQTVFWNGVTYGSLACSAAHIPELYRRLTSQGANILTNSAAIATVGGSKQYQNQSRKFARLHAVANARPFVQSAYGGQGYIIDSNGRLLQQTKQFGAVVVTARVAIQYKKTLYTKLGDWLLWTSFGLVLVVLVLNNSKLYSIKHKWFTILVDIFNRFIRRIRLWLRRERKYPRRKLPAKNK